MVHVSDDLKRFWPRVQVLVTFLNKRDPLTRILSHYRALNAAYWSEKGEKAPVRRGEQHVAHASMLERALSSKRIGDWACQPGCDGAITPHHMTPQDAETISLETWNRFLKEFGMLPALLGLRAAEIIYKRSFCHASVRRSLPTLLCYAA
jgi:hypothetical protein